MSNKVLCLCVLAIAAVVMCAVANADQAPSEQKVQQSVAAPQPTSVDCANGACAARRQGFFQRRWANRNGGSSGFSGGSSGYSGGSSGGVAKSNGSCGCCDQCSGQPGCSCGCSTCNCNDKPVQSVATNKVFRFRKTRSPGWFSFRRAGRCAHCSG